MIVRSALALASPGRLSILVFHRILPRNDPLLPSEPSASEFDALCAHLKSQYNVLPLSRAIEMLAHARLPRRAVAITLDDGYANNLTLAAPILRKHGLTATVFVASGFLQGGCMFNDLVIEAVRAAKGERLDLTTLGCGVHEIASLDARRIAIDSILRMIKYLPGDERTRRATQIHDRAGAPELQGVMLNPDGVRALKSSGLEIGGHTVTHPILAGLGPHEAWDEIVTGKRHLELLLNEEIRVFAYPNGTPARDYSQEHVRMVREAGFAGAVSGAWGAATGESDVFQLPRFTPWARQRLKFDLLMLRNLRRGLEQHAA